MKTVLALRHITFEDLGVFAAPLQEAGYRIDYCDVGIERIDDQAADKADLLVLLGGPAGAYEGALYPFLNQELAIARARLAAQKPILGICLGAQIMALALGAKVAPGPAKEIGWKKLQLTPQGENGLLQAFRDIPVLHWHGDRFELPPGAVNLAWTDICPYQAFTIGHCALGFQCHPEADGALIDRWLIGHACELSGAGVNVNTVRDHTRKYDAATAGAGAACIRAWVGGFGG